MYRLGSKDPEIARNMDRYVRGAFVVETENQNFSLVNQSSCAGDQSDAMKRIREIAGDSYGSLFSQFTCADVHDFNLTRQSTFADDLNLTYKAFKISINICGDVAKNKDSECASNAASQLPKIYVESIDLSQRYIKDAKNDDFAVGNTYFNTYNLDERVYLSDKSAYVNNIYLGKVNVAQRHDKWLGTTIGEEKIEQW